MQQTSVNEKDAKQVPADLHDGRSENKHHTPGRERKARERKPKKAKRPFMHGTREHLTDVCGLGRTLVEEPRSFPGRLKLHLLKWARATWKARGGGFYACGFVVTFLFLEIKLLVTGLFTSAAAADFFVAQFLQLILRFTVDSLVNTLLALIWPLLILGLSPIWGALGLTAGYFAFTRLLKKPLTRLLFDDEGSFEQ